MGTQKARERSAKAATERRDKAERAQKTRERQQKVETERRNKANERAGKQREKAAKVQKERAWKNVNSQVCQEIQGLVGKMHSTPIKLVHKLQRGWHSATQVGSLWLHERWRQIPVSKLE